MHSRARTSRIEGAPSKLRLGGDFLRSQTVARFADKLKLYPGDSALSGIEPLHFLTFSCYRRQARQRTRAQWMARARERLGIFPAVRMK